MLELLFLVKCFFKFTFVLFFYIFFIIYLTFFFSRFYEEYFLITEYFYCQECWDDWNIDWKFISEPEAYNLWEFSVSAISDNFWEIIMLNDQFFPKNTAWEAFYDKFYSEDNYLYPEFRFFFIFTNLILDFWI